MSGKKQILDVQHIHMRFNSKGVCVRAVTDVSFTVDEGETIGIVGESGCGKTTLGRCIVRAYEPSEGEVLYTAGDGETVNFTKIDPKTMKKYRKEIQMIFQDPYSSLDPRMTVYDIIKEPLLANFPKMPKAEMDRRIMDIAAKVGLNTSYLMRYPHAFSGGQRQRIGIARALVLNPRVIVCDESVSALDVSIQAQVINLLHDLQKEFALTYLFISHDLSVVEYISDKVGVMYLGKLVEYAHQGPVQPPHAPLYGEPAVRGACGGPHPADGAHPPGGRDPQSGQPAHGLLLPYPLPVLQAAVQGDRAGVQGAGARPLCSLPSGGGAEAEGLPV